MPASFIFVSPALPDLSLAQQIVWLLVLGVPVACIAWTVTHEEVFREPRGYCERRSEQGRSLVERKFFYLFTCEYCFSHYVALAFLAMTGFHLLLEGWRGYLIAWFALVYVANFYMSAFGRLRLVIKKERVQIEGVKQQLETRTDDGPQKPRAA